MNEQQILNHINDCFQKIVSRLDEQQESIGELLQRVTPVEPSLQKQERIYDTQDLCLFLNTSKRTIQRHRSRGCCPSTSWAARCSTRNRMCASTWIMNIRRWTNEKNWQSLPTTASPSMTSDKQTIQPANKYRFRDHQH